MKKKLILLLSFLLFTTIFNPNKVADAAESKTATIAIPVNTGLIGDDYAAKSYTLDLPSGVTAASINVSTLKYSGNNVLNGSITLENGKIKLNLKGVANTRNLSNLTGLRGSWGTYYYTNPSNSIWRYSDGKRWQINEYDEANDGMKTKDLPAEDNGTPSSRPPRVVVSAAPAQDKEFLKWYDGAQTNIIDSKYIVSSSITPVYYGLLSSSYIKETPKFKNGKVIVNYAIPFMVNEAGQTAEQFYTNQAADASHPLVGHAQGRKYEVYVYYYYTANAKVPTYSYSGSVSFNYSLPTEANLTGNVTILKPNPNPTKFEGKDVAVELSVKGILAAYSDTSNISEWVFSAKEKGIDSTLQTKKDYTKTLTSNKQFDFTIPKAKITSDNYRQEYTLTVTVRFKKPVLTSEGTTDSLSQTFGATVGVGIIPGQTDPPTVTPPPGPTATPLPAKKPPVAVLIAPNIVKAGEEFTLSGGGSYDPDGKIVEYIWDTPGIGDVIIGSSGTTWYSNSNLGENDVGLTVVDNDGMTGSTGGFIEVIEPLPVASLKISGTKKQNRKVLLTNTSSSPKHYPLVDELTKITISAVSGGTSSDIKYSGPLNGVKEKDLLFKQPGTYKATVSVENTLGYKATNSITFEIVPDDPPVVYFSMPGAAYRDPTNGNKATISIDDLSFSPDNDLIARRVWEYRYDSDNDGSFEDESWVTFSDANLDRLNLVVLQVGRYEIRHNVYEEFGQPTIDAFVTAGDRRSADSSTQSSIEKIVDVKNRGPEVDWSW